MTYLTVRTIGAILKGLAYLLGGLLFGILPLLAVVAYKIAKGSVKVTLWTIAAALFIVRSI